MKGFFRLLLNITNSKTQDAGASNLEKFPRLKEHQVALIRADINTGIVLDEGYNYAIKKNQKVFTILENVSEGLKLAKSIILENNSVECVIKDKNENLLYYLTSQNIDTSP